MILGQVEAIDLLKEGCVREFVDLSSSLWLWITEFQHSTDSNIKIITFNERSRGVFLRRTSIISINFFPKYNIINFFLNI